MEPRPGIAVKLPNALHLAQQYAVGKLIDYRTHLLDVLHHLGTRIGEHPLQSFRRRRAFPAVLRIGADRRAAADLPPERRWRPPETRRSHASARSAAHRRRPDALRDCANRGRAAEAERRDSNTGRSCRPIPRRCRRIPIANCWADRHRARGHGRYTSPASGYCAMSGFPETKGAARMCGWARGRAAVSDHADALLRAVRRIRSESRIRDRYPCKSDMS
jgi:hypothetical protein